MTRKHGGGLTALVGPPDRDGTIELTVLDPVGDTLLADEPIKAKWTGERTLKIGNEDVQRLLPPWHTMTGSQTRATHDVLENLKAYPKLFPDAPAADHCPEKLAELGKLLTQPSVKSKNSVIPAAYTYFGQFIAHDVTRVSAEDATDGSDGFNLRTPALDLDSLFGQIETYDQNKYEYQHAVSKVNELRLGPTTGRKRGDFNDLPRSPSGEAQIADARSDHNLGVAQIQVALTKFYGFVVDNVGEKNAKRAFIDHFQWVVLTDYLRRFTDSTTYSDVCKQKPKLLGTSVQGSFLVSLEFAMACFRIGHSMPRSDYQWLPTDNGDTDVRKILQFTYLGGRLAKKSGRSALPRKWRMFWEQFIATDKEPYNGINVSRGLGNALTEPLAELDSRLVDMIETKDGPVNVRDDQTFNLAVQTLLRGNRYGLPSAQDLYCELQKKVDLPISLTGKQIAESLGSSNAHFIQDLGFHDKTPLWFYCMCEAQTLGKGQRLGPLAGRIVMETLYAAIAADKDGILAPGRPKFCPAWPDENGTFDLSQLIKLSESYRLET